MGGSYCNNLVQSSSCSWVGANNPLKGHRCLCLTHRPHSCFCIRSRVVLLQMPLSRQLPPCQSCAWGATKCSPLEMFAVCLHQRGGKPDQPGSSCARVEGHSLWVDIWVSRKWQAPSPSTGTVQVKQGTCGGSLQGPCRTVLSCMGCELAAWGSLKPPAKSQPEERQRRAVSHCSGPPDTH